MPSMFSRRSRSVSTTRPAPSASTSSSAHLAAAQAFLANQPSQPNLSASAAAAALRTMSPAPTPVGQVQTKRMLDRQASNSSIASAPRGRSRGVVQRRPSAGSMTERTFRSPSPGQSAGPPGPVAGSVRDAPPVPALPRTYADDLPPVPVKAHRRSASVDTPAPKTPAPFVRPAGRGQPINQSPPVISMAAAAARRSTNTQQAPELKRSDSQESRNSFNFSYPRGARPNSPPPRSPLVSKSEGFPATATATATNGISAAEVARIQHNISQTADKPVKKKKRPVDQNTIEGSHLQSGTVGGKPTITPLEPLPADHEQPLETQPVRTPKKKAALTGQSSHFPDHENSPVSAGVTSDSELTPDNSVDRRAARASGVLMKQPSVVREDWEGEQEQDFVLAETTAPKPVQPSLSSAASEQVKKPIPAANMSRKIEEPSSASKTPSNIHNAVTTASPTSVPSQKNLLASNIGAQATRGVSVSPSRSTRFSDRLASDLAAGRKHEPLGRSMSPAKSALKHSSITSDASPTDPRFAHRRGSSVTPSEASDVSDGATSRKKSSRVSFEGFNDVKDSLADVRASKAVGKGKSSNMGIYAADDEVEEGMKPRPALPSFGSVRRNERSVSPSGNSKTAAKGTTAQTKSASSSETSSIADPSTMNTSMTSDHALGAFLSRESQIYTAPVSTQKQTELLPSKMTSAAKTGYESDSESAYSGDEQTFKAARDASLQLDKSIGDGEMSTSLKDDIPVIAVQPATPGLDESRPGEEWAVDIPGGFPVSGASSDGSAVDHTEQPAVPTTPVKDSTGLGLNGANQGYTSPATRDTPVNSSPQPLMTIDEEDSDNDSVYSDAAEDIEGDGFGSINAIVGSPVVSPQSQRVVAPAASPVAASSERRPTDMDRSESWEDTQAHWSGLAQRFRNASKQSSETSSEAAPVPGTSINSSVTVPRTDAQPITKAVAQPVAKAVASKSEAPKTASKTTSAPAKPPMQSGPTAAARLANQPPPSAVIATKTVSEPKAQGPLKSSMRGQPQPILKQPRERPASYAAPSSPPRVSSPPRTALQKKTLPTAAPPAALSRTFSNDSDSDSSFRKARRNRKSADNKYTMRKSMRSGPTEVNQPAPPTGRMGVRSLSPPVNRRPTSPIGAKSMRTTMRGSVDLGTPTLRPQPPKQRSSSLFSRNRTAKSPTRPMSAVPALPSKLKSRIANSDDEDEPRPSQYKSRFADSSDEDEPQPLRPVRGIPKRKDEVDSTDLDDSSDDGARQARASAPPKLTINLPPANQEIASPPLSPTTAKKRGLWGRLRGKKKEDDVPPNAGNTIVQREKQEEVTDVVPPPKENKEELRNAKQLGFNSAAERDALIEQTRLKLEEGSKERPQSPNGKIQRRMTPQRVFSDSFAPPKMPAAMDDRPQTADGVDQIVRPGVGSRQATGTTERVNSEGAVYGRTGKKKKFSFLRKAFGLND